MSKSRSPFRRLLAGTVAAAALWAGLGGVPRAEAVIGGIPTASADFPFRGYFTLSDCDGTLIAPDWVLTSASCATTLLPGFDYFRRDGQLHILSTYSGDRIIHPLWNGNPSNGHDLALMRLPFPAPAAPTVQVGSPWDPAAFQPGRASTMLGSEPYPHILERVTTPLRSDADMAGIFNGWSGPVIWNAERMIGAGTTTQTACQRDKGAPLLVRRLNRWVQVGVASFVATAPTACQQSAGFSELSGAHLAWIASVVPTITAAWGPCTLPSGAVGQTSARYLYGQLPGGLMDGPYSWEVACYDGPPPAPVPWPQPDPEPEPEPEPEPDPDPWESPICRNRPWLCEDQL